MPKRPVHFLCIALAAVLIVSSCKDETGPSELTRVSFALQPVFESQAAGLVTVTAARIVVTQLDSTTVVADTVTAITGDSADLSISVLVTDPTAGYLLWMLQRVNLGEPKAEWLDHEFHDVDRYEMAAWVPLLVFILAIGYYITPALVGGRTGQLISNFIAFHMQSSLNWGLAAALGGILLGGVLALYWLYNSIVGIDNMKLG